MLACAFGDCHEGQIPYQLDVGYLTDSYSLTDEKGLPLRNQSSQWFALYYLDGLDRLIKEQFRVKYYTRYMDDGILLDFINSKEPEDDFIRELDEKVQSVRKNEKWRLDYMTSQMSYQEKYEQGVEQEKIDSAMGMIEDGDLPLEKVVMYSGFTLEEVL